MLVEISAGVHVSDAMRELDYIILKNIRNNCTDKSNWLELASRWVYVADQNTRLVN